MATGLQPFRSWQNGRGSCECARSSEQERIATISEHDPVSQCQSYEKYDTDQVSRTNSANTRYLKQSVQITGYGNQSFERLRNDMARIFAIFKRTIGPQLQDEGVVSQEDGFVAIDASNRYFSVRSESNQGDECDITEDMDPKGHLRKAAGTKYIHAEDNRVCYFEKYEDCEGGAW